MNTLQKVLTVVFFITSVILAYLLVNSIKSKIDEDKFIKEEEAAVIERLKMIRDGEIAFSAANSGSYTSNFDTLISFIDTGKVYITQRREEIEELEYGREEVTVFIDTLGSVSVFDSLFIIKEPVSALSDGTITNIAVKNGDNVKNGQTLFVIQRPKGRKLPVKANNDGTISQINVTQGQTVKTEQNLAILKYDRIDDIKNIRYLPKRKSKKKNTELKEFELFAGQITKGGVTVNVFEAKDTDPINPARKGKNKEKALKVGSRTDVTTSGNWE